jgi:hypothetical protein
VHCDADQLAAAFLALARVNSRPDFHAEAPQIGADRGRALDGAGGAVEGDEEPSPAVSTSRPRKRRICSRTMA